MFQACRSCGCTNFSACAPACWWVDDDLCSTCAIAVDVATGKPLTAEEIVGATNDNIRIRDLLVEWEREGL